MSAWPNSQPGGKLFEKFEHYFRMSRSQSVKWEIKKQNKSKTNLLGVHKDRSTVLSHTREQYSWLSLPRTLKPNWDPHWLTEMALISLYWDKKKNNRPSDKRLAESLPEIIFGFTPVLSCIGLQYFIYSHETFTDDNNNYNFKIGLYLSYSARMHKHEDVGMCCSKGVQKWCCTGW